MFDLNTLQLMVLSLAALLFIMAISMMGSLTTGQSSRSRSLSSGGAFSILHFPVPKPGRPLSPRREQAQVDSGIFEEVLAELLSLREALNEIKEELHLVSQSRLQVEPHARKSPRVRLTIGPKNSP